MLFDDEQAVIYFVVIPQPLRNNINLAVREKDFDLTFLFVLCHIIHSNLLLDRNTCIYKGHNTLSFLFLVPNALYLLYNHGTHTAVS